MEALMRLRQTALVADYTSQFEALSNRLRGISEKNRLSCFLSGLKDEIRLPVRMLNPANLVAAFGLAKLQEEYIFISLYSVTELEHPCFPGSFFFSAGPSDQTFYRPSDPENFPCPNEGTQGEGSLLLL